MRLLISIALTASVMTLSCDTGQHVGNGRAEPPPIPKVEDRWAMSTTWKMAVSPDGRWGYDPQDLDGNGNNAGAEYPKGSGYTVLFAGGLYIGVKKNGRSAVSQAEFASEFSPGHIVNQLVPVPDLKFSPADSSPVFMITETPFEMDWLVWPSHEGAPTDLLGNPLAVSNLDTWSVFHDLDSSGKSDGPDMAIPLGLEVRRRTFLFDFPILERAFFIDFAVVNKSNENYEDARISLWCDHDLNDASDDLKGTDIQRNMMFVYNEGDESTPSGRQYALGYRLLYWSDGGGLNATLSSSAYYYNGADPVDDIERYNLQQGRTQLGHTFPPTVVDSIRPNFVFPGDPVAETGVYDTDGCNCRILPSVGPFTLSSGHTSRIIWVVVVGLGNTRKDAILDLRDKSDRIKNFFDQALAGEIVN